VKNRFQSLPFKCNLQRYNTAEVAGLPHRLSVLLNSVGISGDPFAGIEVLPGAISGAKCVVTEIPSGISAASDVMLTVEARDTYGNGVPPTAGSTPPFVASATLQLPAVGAALGVGASAPGTVVGAVQAKRSCTHSLKAPAGFINP
jgi:hypothetical protein